MSSNRLRRKRQGEEEEEAAESGIVATKKPTPEDDGLDREGIDPELIEAELRRTGFLGENGETDPYGIRARMFEKDPILLVLLDPNRLVEMPDGTMVRVIDDLIRSSHEACKKTLGDRYTEFVFVQHTVESLLASQDTHAKQMIFLCMLGVMPAIQKQMAKLYPTEAGREALADFVVDIKKQMDETFKTPYVNKPTIYNVSHLLRVFLATLCDKYPG